jgi:hypothetical protein
MAFVGQDLGEKLPDADLVVDHEDVSHGCDGRGDARAPALRKTKRMRDKATAHQTAG